MTEKEIRLINIINEHDKPGLALNAAIQVILDFLEQPKSSEEQAPVVLRELA